VKAFSRISKNAGTLQEMRAFSGKVEETVCASPLVFVYLYLYMKKLGTFWEFSTLLFM